MRYPPDLSDAAWKKSSHSDGNNSTCVEVALNLRGVVAVRDSTDPSGPALVFGDAEWSEFTGRLKLPRT
jgi:hypothetical protein